MVSAVDAPSELRLAWQAVEGRDRSPSCVTRMRSLR
jgi:hypothetical protein